MIPAVAYYFALYMIVHLKAKRRGIGTLSERDLVGVRPIAPRAYLFLPPLILIALLVLDYSAVMAAMAASVAALAICYARAGSRLGARGWVDMVEEIAKQSAQVAVPIIAIGIIIAVAIQSNLALKFSTQLIELSGGTLIGAMLMIIVGCIVMGMGLPTVAAYIIGAILFVPALTKLGIRPPRRALLRDVLLRAVDDHAAGRARVVRGRGPRQGRLDEDRLDRVQALARAVPDPVRVRLRPGAAVERAARLDPGWLFASLCRRHRGLGRDSGRATSPARSPRAERGLFGCASLAIIFAPTGTVWWSVGTVLAVAGTLVLRLPAEGDDVGSTMRRAGPPAKEKRGMSLPDRRSNSVLTRSPPFPTMTTTAPEPYLHPEVELNSQLVPRPLWN